MNNKNILEQRVAEHFAESSELKKRLAPTLALPIAAAIQSIAKAVTNGGKVLLCGNGGSAADAQHFAAEFVGRFERERPELAAIALTTDSSNLTAIANDYGYDHVFSRQVRALGRPGDVLILISTSGNSPSILEAFKAAQERAILVIALTGRQGGKLGAGLAERDIHICVPTERTARIQEVHILALHCICDGVDALLFDDLAPRPVVA